MIGIVGRERISRSIAIATKIGEERTWEKIPSLWDYESSRLLNGGRTEALMKEDESGNITA